MSDSLKSDFCNAARAAIQKVGAETVEEWLKETITSMYQRQMSDPPIGKRMSSKKAVITDDGDACDVEYELCDNVVGLTWSEELMNGVHYYVCNVQDAVTAPAYVGILQGDGYKPHHSLEGQGAALVVRAGESVRFVNSLGYGQGEIIDTVVPPRDVPVIQVAIMIDLTTLEASLYVNDNKVVTLLGLRPNTKTMFAISNSGQGGKFHIVYEDRTPPGFSVDSGNRYASISPRNKKRFTLVAQRASRGVISEQDEGVRVEFEHYAQSVGVMVDPQPLNPTTQYSIFLGEVPSTMWFGLISTTSEDVLHRLACDVRPINEFTIGVGSNGRVMCPPKAQDTFDLVSGAVAVTERLVLKLLKGEICINDVCVAKIKPQEGGIEKQFHFICSNEGSGASVTIYRHD